MKPSLPRNPASATKPRRWRNCTLPRVRPFICGERWALGSNERPKVRRLKGVYVSYLGTKRIHLSTFRPLHFSTLVWSSTYLLYLCENIFLPLIVWALFFFPTGGGTYLKSRDATPTTLNNFQQLPISKLKYWVQEINTLSEINLSFWETYLLLDGGGI